MCVRNYHTVYHHFFHTVAKKLDSNLKNRKTHSFYIYNLHFTIVHDVTHTCC